MNFADRMTEAVHRKRSVVVVGLDPRPDLLPAEIAPSPEAEAEAVAQAVLRFGLEVIRAVAPVAVAIKAQSAFYEALGWPGMRALAQTLAAAREAGLLTIADMKRNDIGATAEAYARAAFEALGADAVTVNPYFGSDGVAPFARYCAEGRGVFVLVRTSNPSSSEVQDWPGEGRALWRRVAELVRGWGRPTIGRSGYAAVGAVVGATFPDAAAEARRLLPEALFLVPGYGAQGADAASCRACFGGDGGGAVVNSSRGIIHAYASQPWRPVAAERGWAAAVRAAAEAMRNDLERVRRA